MKKMRIVMTDPMIVCRITPFAGTLFLFTFPNWWGRRFSMPDTNSSRANA
jgi:hypothetical protein